MKKLITLVMLSILTVMTANAAVEIVLWEGNQTLSYTPWQPDSQDPAFLTKDDFAAFAVGQKLHFYLTPENFKDGHLYRFSKYTGAENSLGIADAYLWYEEGKTHNVVLTVTQDIKDAVAAGGFAICGQRLRLIKVTKEASFPNMEPKVLYSGEKTITTWGDCVILDAASVAMTSDNNLYILVSDYSDPSCDLRISNNDNWDLAYPSSGYNFLQDVDANGIVTVAMTKAFFDEVADGSKKQISVWGKGGFTIKAIATTKETLLSEVTTDANGYATYSSNYTLALDNLPAGLEAYTATLTGTTLSFTQKDVAVGSGTGLLMKGDANTTYYVPAKTDATAPAYNALSANLTAQDLASDGSTYIFVMVKATSAGSLTFKKLPATATTIPANKAYVQVAASAFTTPAHELSISFGEGEVTGISEATLLNINEVIKNNNVYDLSGRRVAKPTKGLYIVNGKKVVIK